MHSGGSRVERYSGWHLERSTGSSYDNHAQAASAADGNNHWKAIQCKEEYASAQTKTISTEFYQLHSRGFRYVTTLTGIHHGDALKDSRPSELGNIQASATDTKHKEYVDQ